MSEDKKITVKWVGGNSMPNPTVSPHDLMDASTQFMDHLRETGLNEATVLSTWRTWLEAAERIAVEAIRCSVPSESSEDYLAQEEQA